MGKNCGSSLKNVENCGKIAEIAEKLKKIMEIAENCGKIVERNPPQEYDPYRIGSFWEFGYASPDSGVWFQY